MVQSTVQLNLSKETYVIWSKFFHFFCFEFCYVDLHGRKKMQPIFQTSPEQMLDPTAKKRWLCPDRRNERKHVRIGMFFILRVCFEFRYDYTTCSLWSTSCCSISTAHLGFTF